MPKPSPLVVSAPMRECRLWSTIPCWVLNSSSSIRTDCPSHPIQRHITPLLVSRRRECRANDSAAHHLNGMTTVVRRGGRVGAAAVLPRARSGYVGHDRGPDGFEHTQALVCRYDLR